MIVSAPPAIRNHGISETHDVKATLMLHRPRQSRAARSDLNHRRDRVLEHKRKDRQRHPPGPWGMLKVEVPLKRTFW